MFYGTYRDLYRNYRKVETKLDNILLYVDFLYNRYEAAELNKKPVIILKDRSLLLIYKVTGLDYEGLSEEEKEQLSYKIRIAIEKLDKGFTVESYLIREKVDCIQVKKNPNAPDIINYVQQQKQVFWQEIADRTYKTSLYLTVKYTPKGIPKKPFLYYLSDKKTFHYHMAKTMEDVEELEKGAMALISSLKDFGVDELNREEVHKFLYRLINRKEPPRYNPDESLNAQLADSYMEFGRDYIRINEKWHMKALTIKHMPESSISMYFSRLYQLKFPLVVKQSYQYMNYPKVDKKMKFDQNIARSLSAMDKNSEIFVDEVSEFQNMVQGERQTPLYFTIYLYIFAESLDEMKENQVHIENIMREIGFQVLQEKGNSFRACTFFQYPGHDKFTDRKKIVLSTNAGDFINMFSLYPGDRNPVDYFLDRNGGVFAYDPFTERENAHHMLITGPTGSGKSFFVNKLIVSSLVHDPTIFVIDLSRSFTEIFQLLQDEMPDQTSILTLTQDQIDFQF
ncbi:MAG: ATP-binding protein, partial [Bacteroidales bacterium]|nr:ATP-binding protein [Bacteroidales bacterium]